MEYTDCPIDYPFFWHLFIQIGAEKYMGRLLSDDDYGNMLSHDIFDEDHIFYTFDARSVILSLSHSM